MKKKHDYSKYVIFIPETLDLPTNEIRKSGKRSYGNKRFLVLWFDTYRQKASSSHEAKSKFGFVVKKIFKEPRTLIRNQNGTSMFVSNNVAVRLYLDEAKKAGVDTSHVSNYNDLWDIVLSVID